MATRQEHRNERNEIDTKGGKLMSINPYVWPEEVDTGITTILSHGTDRNLREKKSHNEETCKVCIESWKILEIECSKQKEENNV